MTILQSLLFGLVEGLTEFIPVSSTGHMLLVQWIFGIPANASVFSYLVLVQLGPVAALIVYFWSDLWLLIKAFFTRPGSSPENRLAWYLIVATMPALIAGALLSNVVEKLFQSPLSEAAIRFFTAAVLLRSAELLGKRARNLDSLTGLDALIIGFFQVLAVFPGASRSGSTIAGGMLRNFDRPAAARFAFLVSVPVMLAAGVYQIFATMRLGIYQTFLPLLLLGMLVSAISGWLSIRWLIRYLNRHSLNVFAVYCALLGGLCLGLLWI